MCLAHVITSVSFCNIPVVLGLGLRLEEVVVFDSNSENRDRAIEALESLSEAREY